MNFGWPKPFTWATSPSDGVPSPMRPRTGQRAPADVTEVVGPLRSCPGGLCPCPLNRSMERTRSSRVFRARQLRWCRSGTARAGEPLRLLPVRRQRRHRASPVATALKASSCFRTRTSSQSRHSVPALLPVSMTKFATPHFLQAALGKGTNGLNHMQRAHGNRAYADGQTAPSDKSSRILSSPRNVSSCSGSRDSSLAFKFVRCRNLNFFALKAVTENRRSSASKWSPPPRALADWTASSKVQAK